MAVFWSYFRDFVGAQKIEDLTESKNVFAEVFQITSRFVLTKQKNNGGLMHFISITLVYLFFLLIMRRNSGLCFLTIFLARKRFQILL